MAGERNRTCEKYDRTIHVAHSNRPFPSCFEPHYESEASCIVFIIEISFHSQANKTNFNMKSFLHFRNGVKNLGNDLFNPLISGVLYLD